MLLELLTFVVLADFRYTVWYMHITTDRIDILHTVNDKTLEIIVYSMYN